MKKSHCIWCGNDFEYERHDLEHYMFCQPQLNWPIAEFNETTGKMYIRHPDYPNVLFERIAPVN